MGARFRNDGLRTDGREVRPHKPWRVNDGTETANRSVAPGVNTPPTNFASAFDPRGLRQATGTLRFGGKNPTTGPLARSSSFAEQETARRQTEIDSPLWAAHRPLQGPTLAGPPVTRQPGLSVPSDGPSAPPMFAAVSDMGAEPTLNTAQKWTRAGKQAAANGWVTTTPQQVHGINSRYRSPSPSRLALGGQPKPLPY